MAGRRARRLVVSALVGLCGWSSPSASAGTADRSVGENELVSVRVDGTAPAHYESYGSAVSADGRYVAFGSAEPHLASGSGRPRGQWHVYLRDRETGTTTAVDVRPDGRFGNGPAELYGRVSISADGRFVAFTSNSTNLVPGGHGKHFDVFVRDTRLRTTVAVSGAADGGRGNGLSNEATISADGSTVVFTSAASNLLADPPSGKPRGTLIYRRDLAARITSLVSRTPTGDFPHHSSYLPTVSGDGALVAYTTEAGNIVPGGQPNARDVVLYDARVDDSTLVSRPPSGERPDAESVGPSISSDGTAIAFTSFASNLVRRDKNDVPDIFHYAISTGVVTLVTHSLNGGAANQSSYEPVIDAAGGRIAFDSYATNLVEENDANLDADVFVVDLSTGVTTLASRTSDGAAGDNGSHDPSISADGSLVTYSSYAADLVAGTKKANARVYAYRVL